MVMKPEDVQQILQLAAPLQEKNDKPAELDWCSQSVKMLMYTKISRESRPASRMPQAMAATEAAPRKF